MKPRLALVAVGVLTFIALLTFKLVRHGHTPAAQTPPAPLVEKTADGATLTTTRADEQVFQRAFWRAPAADDRILHAERREWSTDTGGVRRWRWFIAVQPGPAMKTWLATNPFALATTTTPKPFDDTTAIPAWFPKTADGFTAQQNPSASLTFLFSEKENLLYATDSGEGFASPTK